MWMVFQECLHCLEFYSVSDTFTLYTDPNPCLQWVVPKCFVIYYRKDNHHNACKQISQFKIFDCYTEVVAAVFKEEKKSVNKPNRLFAKPVKQLKLKKYSYRRRYYVQQVLHV